MKEFFPPGYIDEFLTPLVLHIVSIAVVSVGGGVAVLPDAFRFMVETKKWLSADAFTSSVALAQAAPGPNILMWSLITYQASINYGPWIATFTAAVALLAFIVPTCSIAFVVNRQLESRKQSRFIKSIKTGLMPLTAGIVIASGWLLTHAAASTLINTSMLGRSWIYIVALGVALFSYFKPVNPLWMVGTGAIAGILFGQ